MSFEAKAFLHIGAMGLMFLIGGIIGGHLERGNMRGREMDIAAREKSLDEAEKRIMGRGPLMCPPKVSP